MLCRKLFVEAQSAAYPTIRFVPWDRNKALSAAETLGYNSTSWDNPGTNPIERLTYELIVVDSSLSNAVAELEIDKQSWDCYINHYRGYTWPELANTFKNAYRALGWTHVSWNQIADPPESEGFEWDMLNSDQRSAAETLCYFEKLWDSIPIYEWDNENSNSMASMVPSSNPMSATAPSYSPTLNDEMSPSSKPLATTSLPSSMIRITRNPMPFESSTPSSSPSLATRTLSSEPSRLVLLASVQPTMLPTTQLTIPIPHFRYVSWSKLSDDTRVLAILLGYTQQSWDLPGLATIEHMSFDMIKLSKDSKQIVYIQALGFGKPSWDCYMTHYKTYDWAKLSEYGVQQYYEILGWTEQLWNNSDASHPKVVPWKDLNIAERIAAESLCYLEPIWNNVSLEDEVAWRVSPSPSSSSSYFMKTFSWATFISCFFIHVGL
jgi:hypothetical protein